MKSVRSIFFWFILIILIIVSLLFGYKYYYKNYYLPSNNSIITEFNIADLKEEEIYYKCSKEHAISVLGEPLQKTNEYNNYTQKVDESLIYENITLFFSDNELYSMFSSSEKLGIKDIKIGDDADKVLNNFYNANIDNSALDSSKNVIGKYIYGNFNVDNLEEIQTNEAVTYAYKTTNMTSNGKDSYELIYAYMCPPYKGDYASAYDTVAQLIFSIVEDKVFSICWIVDSYVKDFSSYTPPESTNEIDENTTNLTNEIIENTPIPDTENITTN